MPRSYPERRRFPRFHLEHALVLKVAGNGGPAVPAHTLDIGAGGCRLVLDASIGAGSEIEVAITVADRVIRALGRVVYELPLRSARFQAGVEFLRLDPEDRAALADLLSDRTATSEN